MDAQDERQSEDAIAKAVRGALSAEQFDYPALVAGVHQRAGRIRRRRAIVSGAAAAVLAPALIGGAALVLPDLLPGDTATVAPAASGDAASSTSAAPDDAAATSTPHQPPWQDPAPPQPEGGWEAENPDYPNAWVIPDARPTGVDFLDSLAAPMRASNYPRTVPVSGLMTCDPERPDGIEPEAGQSFSFFDGTQPGRTVELQITGWADSDAALAGLVNDSTTLCTWDPVDRQALTWEGHEGDRNRVLYAVGEGQAAVSSAAIVRQGDYLVAVTVSDGPGVATTDVAAEIADKTAANLEALDPLRGRD